MSKLTGVLIGCGAIAREHLSVLAELDNVEIVAVCDISTARAEAAAERFGIARSYASHRDLLADLECAAEILRRLRKKFHRRVLRDAAHADDERLSLRLIAHVFRRRRILARELRHRGAA